MEAETRIVDDSRTEFVTGITDDAGAELPTGIIDDSQMELATETIEIDDPLTELVTGRIIDDSGIELATQTIEIDDSLATPEPDVMSTSKKEGAVISFGMCISFLESS